MPNYLLELGTEELPAAFIPDAQAQLEELFTQGLADANLTYGLIETLATPRRLAVIVTDLQDSQPTTEKRVKGPKVAAAFKPDGTPTPAAVGFAQKNGVPVQELEKETVGKDEYLVANLVLEGRGANEVLSEMVPRIIARVTGERLMRWGNREFKFSRPIRWIVSVLDGELVSFDVEGLEAGKKSHGHRILAPQEIDLSQAREKESYKEALRNVNVLVDPNERRELITSQVDEMARAVNGKSRQLSGSLLDEVVNIVEWPRAVAGEFANEYLELPDMLLETIMVHHQRYFPVEKEGADGNTTSSKSNNLLPFFITISNNDRDEAQPIIKKGNERVLKARLADGKFFYFDDQKTRLTERDSELEQLTYQHGLGSYKDKVERLKKLSRVLSDSLKLDAKLSVCLERTVELCKLDLVTNLVGELPELQGFVGSWYAEKEGEPPEVARAIASHYSPRHTDDAIPQDSVGQLTAILDKLDHIVGLFSLGKNPSGSSDPFALRRQAQGLVDILIEGLTDHRVNLSLLVDFLLSEFEPSISAGKKKLDSEKVRGDLCEFIIQRLRGKLLDMGFRREIVEAVLNSGDPLADVTDVVIRCQSLETLVKSDSEMKLIRAGVRVGNILKPDSESVVDESAISEAVEKELWSHFKKDVKEVWEKSGNFMPPRTKAEYEELLSLISKLSPLIDKFFEDVMVNDPDKAKKDLRHAILKNIYFYFHAVADFQKLQPLLP